MLIPPLEYWFTGAAIISVVSFLYATCLALAGLKTATRPKRYASAIIILLVLLVAQWWQAAQQEYEKEKPDYDYAYATVNPEVPLNNGSAVIYLRASANLHDVYLAWDKTTDYPKNEFYKFLEFVRGGTQDAVLLLPLGKWTFDIDAPGEHGKVRQQLSIGEKNGKAILLSSRVVRKDPSGVMKDSDVICVISEQENTIPCP